MHYCSLHLLFLANLHSYNFILIINSFWLSIKMYSKSWGLYLNFKSRKIPTSKLFFYWYNFLKLTKTDTSFIKIMIFFSIISLILYVLFLGESKVYASFFRRVGIYIYIFFTVLSQYLVSKKNFFNNQNKSLKKSFLKYKYILSLSLLIGGIILLPILIIKIDNLPGIKNIISWNYFLLIQTYFLLSYLYLRN